MILTRCPDGRFFDEDGQYVHPACVDFEDREFFLLWETYAHRPGEWYLETYWASRETEDAYGLETVDLEPYYGDEDLDLQYARNDAAGELPKIRRLAEAAYDLEELRCRQIAAHEEHEKLVRSC
jgi:hypothetical protein